MTTEQSNEILAFAAEVGHTLLENGAEISRVEETMKIVAASYGVDKEHFFVLSNGIFTTGSSYANVEFIPIKGASLDKVVEVNQLSREISAGKYTLEEARVSPDLRATLMTVSLKRTMCRTSSLYPT